MRDSIRRSRAALHALSIALALACVAAPLCAQTPTPLADTITALLSDSKVSAAHWGISVTTLDGTPIYALNDAQLFQPDSNTKLFTTAAALHLLGPNMFFVTTVEGEIDKSDPSIVDGNLTLVAGGDDNLSGRQVPYQAGPTQVEANPLHYLKEFADTLASRGIKHINGDVSVSDQLWPWEPYASGWDQDDLVWGYGAPISALTINDNSVKLTVQPAKTAGDRAILQFSPDMPGDLKIDNLVTTISNGPTVINVDYYLSSRIIQIAGSIAVKSPVDGEELSIDEPITYVSNAFKHALEADGITIAGYARGDHREYKDTEDLREELTKPISNLPTVATDGSGWYSCVDNCPLIKHESPTVLEDVTLTNKLSLNLHAEMLLKHLGKQYANEATFAQGARVVRQFAINAGIQPDDFYFVDGSGLSTYDLAAPRAFTALLRYAATQPWGAGFKSSLPIGGVDGTLRDRFTAAPLRGNVIAKTGTHSEGRALSGYLTCASGRTVVFSILDDHHLPGTTADRDVMDKIVAAIYSAN